MSADDGINLRHLGEQGQVLFRLLMRHRHNHIHPVRSAPGFQLSRQGPSGFDRIAEFEELDHLAVKGIGKIPPAQETDQADRQRADPHHR